MIEFEWDSHNLKHIIKDYPERGNSAEEIESVFLDPDYFVKESRFVANELRATVVGMGISGVVKVVICAVDDRKIRPITCWPANKQTKKVYHERAKRKGCDPE